MPLNLCQDGSVGRGLSLAEAFGLPLLLLPFLRKGGSECQNRITEAPGDKRLNQPCLTDGRTWLQRRVNKIYGGMQMVLQLSYQVFHR